MDKTAKRFLLIYVTPICLLSFVSVFIAPPLVSAVILGMLSGVGLLCLGIAFLIDYLDGK